LFAGARFLASPEARNPKGSPASDSWIDFGVSLPKFRSLRARIQLGNT
jgi:hypothetical protein